MYEVAKVTQDRYGNVARSVQFLVSAAHLPSMLANIMRNTHGAAVEVVRVH